MVAPLAGIALRGAVRGLARGGGGSRGKMLTMHTDVESVARSVRKGGRRATKAAVRKAANHTVGKVNTKAGRLIAERRNLKVGEVKKGLKPFKQGKASRTAHIEATGRPVSLTKLATKPTQKKGGVSVKTRAGKSPTFLEGAFVARMASGHVGVFYRRGKKRLPIREATLPSIAHTMGDVSEPLRKAANEFFGSRIHHELERELAKVRIKRTMKPIRMSR
ncbi:MAG: phage tail protein [bacterium]